MYTIETDLINPLTRIRYEKGLTSAQLAKMAGVSQGRIAQVENGIHAKKFPKKLFPVVKKLGYEPEQIAQEYSEWLNRKEKAGRIAVRVRMARKRKVPILELNKE